MINPQRRDHKAEVMTCHCPVLFGHREPEEHDHFEPFCMACLDDVKPVYDRHLPVKSRRYWRHIRRWPKRPQEE